MVFPHKSHFDNTIDALQTKWSTPDVTFSFDENMDTYLGINFIYLDDGNIRRISMKRQTQDIISKYEKLLGQSILGHSTPMKEKIDCDSRIYPRSHAN